MNLPIYNDNLKSSGSWASQLESGLWWWREGLAGEPEQREALLGEVRRQQLAAVPDGLTTAGLSRAIDAADQWAGEVPPQFDTARLLELHRLLIGTASGENLLRTGPPPLISSLHDPAPATLLPRMLELAFDWFSTEGFGELHPVEQATVVYLRLLDLHPFDDGMETTALLAAGFYTRRAGLPPLIIPRDEVARERYRQALDAAFRMLTQPLVEFFAAMLVRREG